MHPVRDESFRKRICEVFHAADDEVHVLRVIGEIDVYTAPLLAAQIAKCADASGVIMDLSQCQFLSAAGLSLISRLHKKKQERLCIVAAPDGFAYKVLCITELDEAMRVVSTVDEALMHLRKPGAVPHPYVETTHTDEHASSAHRQQT